MLYGTDDARKGIAAFAPKSIAALRGH